MEEFDKWDMQEYPLPPTIERGPIGRDCLEQRKKAWQAALEWTLTQVTDIEATELEKAIRRELEKK